MVSPEERPAAADWRDVEAGKGGRSVYHRVPVRQTLGDVLYDISLYWLTNAVSPARLDWELRFSPYNAVNVSIPAAVSVFPGENYQAPRSWTERAYHNLIYDNTVDEGGRHAASE